MSSRRAAFALAAVLTLMPGTTGTAVAAESYGGGAGFVKARTAPRRSIRVQADFSAKRLAPLLARWNHAAGWRLFVRVTGGGDVRYVRGGQTYVAGLPSNSGPFTRCVIHYDRYDKHTLTHEIGHCLGLSDSVLWQRDMSRWVSASQCDRPDKKYYRRYHGVMSYCDWWDEFHWFGAADRALLRRTHYRP
jgi:hypothetical protein